VGDTLDNTRGMAAAPAPGPLDRTGDPEAAPGIAACLLLAGGLKASPLAAATGLSPLDLHLLPETTVFDAWLMQCGLLAAGRAAPLPVRVIYGDATPAPSLPDLIPPSLSVRTERETRQYRGPAGIARDSATDYPEEATILIAEGARFIAADLRPVIARHHAREAEITVVCNADSSPAGIFIARRRTLDLIPRIGFMDLKEQWLTRAVTSGVHVRVHRLPANQSHELRTPAQFLAAAAAARLARGGSAAGRACAISGPALPGTGFPGAGFPFSGLANGHANDCANTHAGIGPMMGPGGWASPLAQIAPGAVVVDSVVMPGAIIAERCVVVRSIICAGAQLEPGQTVIDQVVRQAPRAARRLAGRHAGRA
jgi:hypothetical protein